MAKKNERFKMLELTKRMEGFDLEEAEADL